MTAKGSKYHALKLTDSINHSICEIIKNTNKSRPAILKQAKNNNGLANNILKLFAAIGWAENNHIIISTIPITLKRQNQAQIITLRNRDIAANNNKAIKAKQPGLLCNQG